VSASRVGPVSLDARVAAPRHGMPDSHSGEVGVEVAAATRRPVRSAAVLGVCLALVVAAVAWSASSSAPRHSAISTKGPLVGLSESGADQSATRPGLPLFLGGNVGIANRDRHPVTVVSATAWGADHLRLTEAAYVVSASTRGVGGFVGQTGQRTVIAAGMAGEAQDWAGTRPLIGARIEPCCRRSISLGLAFMPDLSAGVGRAGGVVITYRTSRGKLYRTFIAAEIGFCVQSSESSQCELESKLEDRQSWSFSVGDIPSSELDQPDSWHG